VPEATQISAEDAIELVAGSGWLLDVREPDEWTGGHAPTAHLIPMGSVIDRIDEIPADAPIVVICHIGYRSWQVTKYLAEAGFDAASVAGGMDAWQSAGGVVVSGGPDSPLD
jgi:rhodanese-related sulfurtransferase